MKPVYFLIGAIFLQIGTSWAGPQKLRVDDRALAQSLVKQGGRLIADYGSFQIIETDQPVEAGVEKGLVQPADRLDFIELNAISLNTRTPQVQSLRTPAARFAGKRLHLVQFVGPIKSEWSEALEQTGVRIVSYVPENAYLIYGDADALARVRTRAAVDSSVQWEGPYLDSYKVHPRARPLDAQGNTRSIGTDTFAIQLVADGDRNPVTLGLLDQWKLRPARNEFDIPGYHNIVVALPAERLPDIAAQPDVVSIHPYFEPRKMDERQDQILAGDVSGGLVNGPGYLDWLASKGFTQAQFDASGFVVDVSDSGIDNGLPKPGHFGLYPLGDPSLKSRVAYNRLMGFRSPGGTLKGCDGHGTLNAHVIAGYDAFSGFPFADAGGFCYGLGVCPFVRVGSSVIFDPDTFTSPNFSKLQTAAYNSGARISNNSWGAPGSDGEYDIDSQFFDILVRDVALSKSGRQMVIVFSAGNEGPDAGTVSSPGTAKNVITVGASENVRSLSIANGGVDANGESGCGSNDLDLAADNANDMTDFSSRGPCVDGRMKPDIVAPGSHVTGGVAQGFSPTTNGLGRALLCFDASGVCALPGGGSPGSADNFFPLGQQFYTVSSGTSHSAPAVCGACALLRQYFMNANLPVPSPAITKACLINSARYLTGAFANDTLWSAAQGMGEVDLATAFDGVPRILRDQLTADKMTFTGQTRTFSGTIADPTKPFRVTLAWTDHPGGTMSAKALVNDLDLTVTAGGLTYRGNVFSGAQSTTGGTADSRNNVESVFLPAGVTGSFTVTITAANIVSDGIVTGGFLHEQDFGLVIYNATSTTLPFVPAAASYSGLFYESNGVQFLASGAMTVTTTTKGSFSGTLQMGLNRYSCSGSFDTNGLASISVARKATNALTLTLKVDTTDDNSITGVVDGGSWVAEVVAERAPFNSKTNPNPLTGRFTVVFPGSGDGDPLTPQGDGYGTVTMNSSGQIKLSGVLADGTKLTQSANLVGRGHWPLYVPLYSGAGQILGWLTFTNSASEDFDGLFSWIKLPVSTARYYPAGFSVGTNAVGSLYLAPKNPATPVLGITNDLVILTGGNLAIGLTNHVTIGAKNLVIDQTLTNKLALTITTAQGSFKGTFLDPTSGKTTAFNGVLLQKQNSGSGYFLGTNESGRVFFGP